MQPKPKRPPPPPPSSPPPPPPPSSDSKSDSGTKSEPSPNIMAFFTKFYDIHPDNYVKIKTDKQNLEDEYGTILEAFDKLYGQRGGDPNESGTGSAVEGVGEASIGVLSTAEGTLASTMGIYNTSANKLKESIDRSTGGKKPKRATKIKCIKNKRIRKLYKGPRGGTYYKSKGRKIYVR
jgi:hypothetical protein